jgi:hypothetical protein
MAAFLLHHTMSALPMQLKQIFVCVTQGISELRQASGTVPMGTCPSACYARVTPLRTTGSFRIDLLCV